MDVRLDWGPFGLTGKAAIITGAGRDVCQACATLFLRAGASVVVTGIAPTAVDELERDLVAVHGAHRVRGGVADLAQPDAAGRVVQTCVDAFGTVDVLVHEAGVYVPVSRDEVTWQLVDDAMRARDLALTSISDAVARQIRLRRSGGAIVAIGSEGSLSGPAPTWTERLTEQELGATPNFTTKASAELAPDGIRVNTIKPGMPATADDVAHAAVFLVSDAARNISGVTIHVDGGTTAKEHARNL